MFFIITALILLANYFFRIFSYPTMQRALLVISYTVILIFYGVKKEWKIMGENVIRFEGINNVITEIKDEELKRLIVGDHRIMAIKRYRAITNVKFNTALRYVNLMNLYYSNYKSK